MDIDSQRLTKNQSRQASHYQKVQQASLNNNLRGLTAEYAMCTLSTASETSRLKIRRKSLQEMTSERLSSAGRRHSPRADKSRCDGRPATLSAQPPRRRMSVSMNDINRRELSGSSSGHQMERRTSGAVSKTRDSLPPPRDATSTVPRVEVTQDGDDSVHFLDDFEALKKCRYLRVRGLDDEALSAEEVFANTR